MKNEALKQIHEMLRMPCSAKVPKARKKPETRKVGRNEPCPCGPGSKFKRCCIRKMSNRLQVAQ